MLTLAQKRPAGQFPVNAGTSCPFAAPVAEALGDVVVKSLSMQGVNLLLTRRVEPGAVLAVTLCNSGKGFARTALVRVDWIDSAPGGYLVGATFVTPLTYHELSTLVM